MSTLTRLRADDDRRYTMRLTLVREGRPKYWEFHCIYCGYKLGEFSANKLYGIDISSDDSLYSFRCPGTNKKWCRMWYEIQLYA